MASWNIPALINKIASDVPAINTLLKALLKWTTDGTTDVPTDAKRMASVTGGVQLQKYNGTSWGSTGKLMHDVDMLDGKHAATTAQADTIPVRDANGSLPGNVTGNAATASEASSLASDYVVPIANGGTGATSAANARASLGTDNASNITSGILAAARGGTGRSDGKVTDVHLTDYNAGALSVGQIGKAAEKNAVDCDSLTAKGLYYCTGCTLALHYPLADTCFIEVLHGSSSIIQIARMVNSRATLTRTSSNNGASWNGWTPIQYNTSSSVHIYISKDGSDTNTGLSSDSPVLTFGRAVEVARGLSIHGDLRFCFGAGNWGSIRLDRFTINCNSILISNYSYSTASTKSDFDALSDVPSFESIEAVDGVFGFTNIHVKRFNFKESYVLFIQYFKFSSLLSSRSRIDIQKPYTVAYESGNTEFVFDLVNSSLLHAAVQSTFEDGCTQTGFIRPRAGCYIDIFNGTSWNGTFSGYKYDFWCIQNVLGIHPDSYPGNAAGIGNGYNYLGNITANGRIVINKSNHIEGGQSLLLQGTYQNFALAVSATSVTKGTAPSEGKWWGIEFYGKDTATWNQRIGLLECVLDTNNQSNVFIRAYDCRTNTNTSTSAIGVHVDSNGNIFTSAPVPATNDNSNKIATTSFVKNQGYAPGNHTHNYVPVTGGNMSGDLGVPSLFFYYLLCKRHPDFVKGTNPSSTVYWPYFMCDKNGWDYANNCVGILECSVTPEGRVHTYIRALKNAANNMQACEIGCCYDTATDKGWTWTITPETSDNSTKIATTAFVKNQGYINSNYNMRPGNSTANRSANTTYTAANNGWLRVWGSYDLSIAGRRYKNTFWSYASHQYKENIYPVAKGQSYWCSNGGQWIDAT